MRAREAGQELPIPDDPASRLGQDHSLPDWFAALLLEWRGPEGAAAVASACNRVPELDLRVNRLRANREQVQLALAEAGIRSELLQDCPDGLKITGHGGDVRHWPGYSEGHWCVQDRAAQWIAPLLKPQPGDRILDACAAPGGKSTHLAELIADQGEIWAVDRSAGRLKRVAANAARLGLGAINALAADAATLLELEVRPQWRESFQRILIDAPCSGLGTLARHPDARWRVTPASIRALLPQQQALLDELETAELRESETRILPDTESTVSSLKSAPPWTQRSEARYPKAKAPPLIFGANADAVALKAKVADEVTKNFDDLICKPLDQRPSNQAH